MEQKVAGRFEFEAVLCLPTTGKISLSTLQCMGTFFELGKDKSVKERDGLCLSSAVPKT